MSDKLKCFTCGQEHENEAGYCSYFCHVDRNERYIAKMAGRKSIYDIQQEGEDE